MLLNPRYIEKREVHHLPVGRNAELFSACWIKKLDHCSITVDLNCFYATTSRCHLTDPSKVDRCRQVRHFDLATWVLNNRYRAQIAILHS